MNTEKRSFEAAGLLKLHLYRRYTCHGLLYDDEELIRNPLMSLLHT